MEIIRVLDDNLIVWFTITNHLYILDTSGHCNSSIKLYHHYHSHILEVLGIRIEPEGK